MQINTLTNTHIHTYHIHTYTYIKRQLHMQMNETKWTPPNSHYISLRFEIIIPCSDILSEITFVMLDKVLTKKLFTIFFFLQFLARQPLNLNKVEFESLIFTYYFIYVQGSFSGSLKLMCKSEIRNKNFFFFLYFLV